MLRLVSNITIAGKSFSYVNELTVSSSWKTFTDTASIVIPNRFLKNGETIVGGDNNVFKRGDTVTIGVGYYDADIENASIKTVFTGYVSKIHSGSPFKISCEDESWKLKQKTFTKSWKSVSLKSLIGDLVTDIPFEVVDAELGSFKVTRVNVVNVLDELKKTYGLTSFIRDGKLFVGLAYSGAFGTHKFDFNRNIISNDLEFVRDDDVKIKVTAISMLPTNKKIQIETGDPDGDNRTLTFYNLTESELKKTADREIKKLKFAGWRGSFTTFGSPKVQHGDTIELNDDKFPERSGNYKVETVETSFGVGGFRQKIYIGCKA
jgi:hypothetical protein